MLSSRLDGRLAGSGQELPAKLVANFPTAPATASHAPMTLRKLFVWEGSQNIRAGDGLGGPGQPGVIFTGKQANLGAHAL
eukprot:1159416-Pelagomonas_calceolata.AAC.5